MDHGLLGGVHGLQPDMRAHGENFKPVRFSTDRIRLSRLNIPLLISIFTVFRATSLRFDASHGYPHAAIASA
jgi:hypothetical protein